MAKQYSPQELAKLIETDKLDELQFATKDMSPQMIRKNLSDALGQHVADNYDLGVESAINKAKKLETRPLLQKATTDAYDLAPELDINKLYESKIQKPVKLKMFNEPGGDLGFMDTGSKNPMIHLNEANLDKVNPRGVVLHETDHISDMLNKGFIPDDELKVMQAVGKKGLEGAEELYGKHHKRGFFELEALKKLTKNKLLQAVPFVGAGLTANEILKSGDVFAADPTGMLQSDNIGEGSDQLPSDELGEKQKYNNRMKKMRKLMEGE